MTVYVDEAVWPFRGQLFCHMMTDNPDLTELHDMAEHIGMRREWFQDKPHYPHYDLPPVMRARAVAAGAVEITATELVRRCRVD